jgi:hypothetical protein
MESYLHFSLRDGLRQLGIKTAKEALQSWSPGEEYDGKVQL